MRKIPTLFVRDEQNRRYVTRYVTPGCEWVLAGEGIATRKYDGVCVMFDGERWWARRSVKPGKATPPNFVAVETDGVTGETVGWEPIEQSAFAKYHAEALVSAGEWSVLDEWPIRGPVAGGTYELSGPRINGNPEHLTDHSLVRHGYRGAADYDEMRGLVLDFDSLAAWLHAHGGGDDHEHSWEGIVWHHPDGRMAKIKRRDFAAALRQETPA